jgi:Citrate synthase, C-terminal domain
MAEIPKLVSSMGKADFDRIFVRGHDLNEELLGKISFAQMVYLMLVGRMPTVEEGRMIDTMLIVLVDHGMTTGALAARMTIIRRRRHSRAQWPQLFSAPAACTSARRSIAPRC